MSPAINEHVLTRKKPCINQGIRVRASCSCTALVIHFRTIGISMSVAEMKIEMDTGQNDELHSLPYRRNVKNIQLSTIRIDDKQPLHFVNSATTW